MRGGAVVTVGLDFHDSYLPLTVFRFASKDCGLPMVRRRLLLVLLRKDIGTSLHLDNAINLLDIIKSKPLFQCNVWDFISSPGAHDSLRRNSTSAAAMPHGALLSSSTVRKELGLRAYGSRQGSPVSRSPGHQGLKSDCG